MFAVGDRIVYPMHGAGVIEAIEEEKILGKLQKYYVLRVPFSGMKIMIPMEGTEYIGFREIISLDEMADVMKILSEKSTEMPINWNRRYRENMAKLKTGTISNVAEVLRNLMRVERVKKLSTGEKKMLANAKHILVSELVLVKDEEADAMESRIERAVWQDEDR
jgi:CarD family transcriptional regulator